MYALYPEKYIPHTHCHDTSTYDSNLDILANLSMYMNVFFPKPHVVYTYIYININANFNMLPDVIIYTFQFIS